MRRSVLYFFLGNELLRVRSSWRNAVELSYQNIGYASEVK